MAAKLQCEICGGKLVGKPGGIFECENCGTEYSTEWAKAKIQEITGTVKVEGTVEVTGKVQIDGPVKVEGGGPSAESLVKRGMMLMEEEMFEKADSLFVRALEIDPESGDAFWGRYLCEQECVDTSEALQRIHKSFVLEDKNGNFRRARQFAKGELAEQISEIERLWNAAEQSAILPEEMRNDYRIHEGILWKKENASLTIQTAQIPRGVTSIYKHAFKYCKNLTSVTIPEGVTEIGDEAFFGCSGLTTVVIPNSVKGIGNGAFENCENLNSVEIPEGVNMILFSAFKDCKALQSVSIPRSVAYIGSRAFEGCDMVIRAFPDSAAEKYAKENGLTVERILTPEELAKEEEKSEAQKRKLAPVREYIAKAETMIAVGSSHIIALKADGTAIAKLIDERDDYGQCEVADWKDITAVSAHFHSLGLKEDGRVVATGCEYEVAAWNNIAAVCAGMFCLGLKTDGTVVSTKCVDRELDHGQCNVNNWRDIVSISAGDNHSLGLRADGTVVSTKISEKEYDYGQANVSKWRDIVSISAGWSHSLGLKSDGTVVAAGDKWSFQGVENWRDIVSICAGPSMSMALRADGTVTVAGHNNVAEEVSEWRDIVAIAAGDGLCLGLRADGMVLAAGSKKLQGMEMKLFDSYQSLKDKQIMEKQKAEAERKAAERAEAERKAAAERAEAERKAAAERAEAEAKAAAERAEAERKSKIENLNTEKARLEAELTTHKGLFSGGKRRQIEARLAEIEEELKKLG